MLVHLRLKVKQPWSSYLPLHFEILHIFVSMSSSCASFYANCCASSWITSKISSFLKIISWNQQPWNWTPKNTLIYCNKPSCKRWKPKLTNVNYALCDNEKLVFILIKGLWPNKHWCLVVMHFSHSYVHCYYPLTSLCKSFFFLKQ